MSSLSLVNVSSKAVADNFLKGNYDDVDFVFPPSLSDSVFKELRKKPFPSEKVALAVSEKLYVTEVHLQKTILDMNDVRFLSRQNNLQVLNIGLDYCQLKFTDQGEINAMEVLKKCINESSRTTISHIGLSDFQCLSCESEDNWQDTLSEMPRFLPNVISLDLCYCSPTVFPAICANLPNLKSLRIECPYFTSLEDIAKLSELEVFCLGETDEEEFDEFRELCQLGKLRVLEASSMKIERITICISELVAKGIAPFPSLQELDCASSDINEEMFQVIQSSIPTLRLICLVGTSLHSSHLQPTNQELTILNCRNLEAYLKSLQYCQKGEKLSSIGILFKEGLSLFEFRRGREEEVEVRKQLIRKIVELLRRMNREELEIVGRVSETKGYKILNKLCAPDFFDHLTHIEIRGILNLYQERRYRNAYFSTYWECPSYHALYWNCLSELCKRGSLEIFIEDLKEVIIDSIELLKKYVENDVLETVFKFVEEVFENPKYSQLYEDFLSELESPVNFYHICDHYGRRRMIMPLLFNLNFNLKSPEEAFRIKVAHLRIMEKVSRKTCNDQSFQYLCYGPIVADLLSILSEQRQPFDQLGRYAFAILRTIMRVQKGTVDLPLQGEFERYEEMMPL